MTTSPYNGTVPSKPRCNVPTRKRITIFHGQDSHGRWNTSTTYAWRPCLKPCAKGYDNCSEHGVKMVKLLSTLP